MRCCSLEPFCYCATLEPEDREETRVYRTRTGERHVRVRRSTPEQDEALQTELRAAMADYAERRRQARRLRAIGLAFVIVIVIVVMLLAGCDLRDGYVEPSPRLPTPTIMYTVILPQGGIYDNN